MYRGMYFGYGRRLQTSDFIMHFNSNHQLSLDSDWDIASDGLRCDEVCPQLIPSSYSMYPQSTLYLQVRRRTLHDAGWSTACKT